MSLTFDPVQEDERVIPAVPSPYEGTTLSVGAHLKVSAYWFATNFLWGAMLQIMLPHEMGVLAPFYKATAVGLLLGLSAIAAIVIPLIAGALSDRCASKYGRRRPYMVVGSLLNVVGLLCMGIAIQISPAIPRAAGAQNVYSVILSNPGFLLVFAGFLVVQCGNNIATGAYSGIIPDLIPEDQRGRASGYYALLSQIGTLLGIAAIGLLLGGQPEIAKYLLLSAVLLGVGAVTVFGIKENALEYAPPKIAWGSYIRSLWIDPRKYPDFAWVWLTRALVMLGFYSIQPFINYYLDDVIHVANVESSVTAVLGLILVASSVSGLAGGYIADKVGRKKVVYFANSLMAVTCLGFIWCRSLLEVLGVGLLFGIAYGAYISVDWALGTDVLPSRKDAAKEMAVWHVSMTLPQTIAAPIAASLLALPGITTAQKHGELVTHYSLAGYTYVFILCAAFFGLGALGLRNVKGVK